LPNSSEQRAPDSGKPLPITNAQGRFLFEIQLLTPLHSSLQSSKQKLRRQVGDGSPILLHRKHLDELVDAAAAARLG
jgi:hypothetical protein